MMERLANAMVATTFQSVSVSNQHIAYIKLTQFYLSIIPQYWKKVIKRKY